MTATITSYGASYFLDTLFGRRQAPPAAYWVALLTQAPGAQADATMLGEPDANAGYARVLLTNDQFGFRPAASGVSSNDAGVYFPLASANWATVTHYGLCDSLVGGKLFLYGSLATPRKVMAGDIARIPPGLLTMTLANLSPALVSTF